MRIKNLKYDPKHADKKQRAYSHLEFLDRVLTMEQAKRISKYEKKNYGKAVTLEIIEPSRKKSVKVENNAPE